MTEAEELITAKRDAESKKVVKTFDEDPDLMILNGRYGIYISYKKSNYKIPRTVKNPETLTLEQCREIIDRDEAKPKETCTPYIGPQEINIFQPSSHASTESLYKQAGAHNAPFRPDVIETYPVKGDSQLLQFLFDSMPQRKRTTVKELLKLQSGCGKRNAGNTIQP